MGINDVNNTDANDNTQVVLYDDSNGPIGQSSANPLVTVQADNAAVDSFGRSRFSEPTVVFDSYFVETDKDLLWTQDLTGSGTVTRNGSTMEYAVTTASGDKVIRQSKEYIHYIPGQSLLILTTGRMDAGKANLRQRIGYFDDNNGLFFELDGTTLYVVRRTKQSGSVVDNRVAQSSWNSDVLDGTGNSGVTLDITKEQIFFIDAQWLGGGRVRWGFNINGQSIVAHEGMHANSLSDIYMSTGSLPVRYEIENTGVTGSSSTLLHHCTSVITEGQLDLATATRSVDLGTTAKALNTADYRPVLGLRLKSANVRGQLIPTGVKLLASTNDDIIVRLLINPTVSGGTWVSAGTNAISEYNTTATNANITDGELIDTYYIAKSGDGAANFRQSFLKIVGDYSGTSDELWLVAQSLTSAANLYAAINYEELF